MQPHLRQFGNFHRGVGRRQRRTASRTHQKNQSGVFFLLQRRHRSVRHDKRHQLYRTGGRPRHIFQSRTAARPAYLVYVRRPRMAHIQTLHGDSRKRNQPFVRSVFRSAFLPQRPQIGHHGVGQRRRNRHMDVSGRLRRKTRTAQPLFLAAREHAVRNMDQLARRFDRHLFQRQAAQRRHRKRPPHTRKPVYFTQNRR